MYSREELIKICEQAIVSEKKWKHGDTPVSMAQLGRAWAYLKAGCKFEVHSNKFAMPKPPHKSDIYFSITHHCFDSVLNENYDKEKETFYLPTPEKLIAANGGDWNKL